MAREKLTRSDCVAALGAASPGTWRVCRRHLPAGHRLHSDPHHLPGRRRLLRGGKTAVDLEAGKNLVGAFWQPRAVICDTDTFRTLPEDTFLDGVAETVKHGLIADADFLRFLLEADLRGDIDRIVRRDVEIKAAVVGEDEFERGRRKILNFGHTLGHAMEKLSGYGTPHGHAVAWGWCWRPGGRSGWDTARRGPWRRCWRPMSVWASPPGAPMAPRPSTRPPPGTRSGAAITSTWWSLRRSAGAGTVRLDMAGLRAFTEAAVWI